MKSKQCLDVQQMQHLQELGLDTTRFASVCHYKTFFSYYFGEDTSTEWGVDFLYKYTERNGDITLAPKNFAGIPDNDGQDYADVYEIIPSFTLQDIFDLLPNVIEKDNKSYYLEVFRNPQRYIVCYYWCDRPLFTCENESFIDASYQMLCFCVEKGYIKTKTEE